MDSILLCALSTGLKSQRWQVGSRVRIGSQPNLEISCDDPSLSPVHAYIEARKDGWHILDHDSADGTFVNGMRVGRDGALLQLNDVVRCGKLYLKVLPARSEFIRTSSFLVKVQAVAQCSWEHALETFDFRRDLPQDANQHLLTLFRTGGYLAQTECPDELMQTILNETVTVLEAQRGSIVLADEDGTTLHLRKTARAERAPQFRKWYSRSLAERCFSRGQSILCQDVGGAMAGEAEHSTLRQNMSSIICALLRTPRKKLGVLHLDRGPSQPPFTREDFVLADSIAASVSAGLETSQLLEQQRELFLQTVTALARAVEIRDRYTGNHTQRVTEYALMLATELGASPDERKIIKIGTPLHDIGKIGIADSVLQKPGKLTHDEFDHMKTHVQVGAGLLDGIPGLRPMIPLVRHHHERWDGRGYPDRIAGPHIPRLARIVAVADAFDAMTSDRPYRAALSWHDAFAEIHREAGTHFDPECAGAFLRLRPKIEAKAAQTPALVK